MKLNITEMGTWQQKVQVDSDYQMAMLSGSQGPDASAISMRVHSAGAFNLAMVAQYLEKETGIPFIRMDQGSPGLAANQIGNNDLSRWGD